MYENAAVLIPCRNEEAGIARTIDEYKKALPGIRVVVGDNGSTDDTADAALAAGAEVVYCAEPGKAAAMRRLLNAVRADWYLFADGDASYPADAAPKILETAMAHGCMCVGHRDDRYLRQRPFQLFGNRLVNRLISLKYRTKIQDAMSGLRCIPRSLALAFAAIPLHNGFEAEVELTMLAIARGVEIRYVPCAYLDRAESPKGKPRTVRDGSRIIWAVLSCPFHRPKIK